MSDTQVLVFVLSPHHVHHEKFLFLPNLHVPAGPQGAFFLRRVLQDRETRLKSCQAHFLSSINCFVSAGLREDDSAQLPVRRLAVLVKVKVFFLCISFTDLQPSGFTAGPGLTQEQQKVLLPLSATRLIKEVNRLLYRDTFIFFSLSFKFSFN